MDPVDVVVVRSLAGLTLERGLHEALEVAAQGKLMSQAVLFAVGDRGGGGGRAAGGAAQWEALQAEPLWCPLRSHLSAAWRRARRTEEVLNAIAR